MADVFAEVDEAMRREKLEKLWREHGKFFIAAIVAVILATGIISGWRSWNNSVDSAHTAKLMLALESDTPAETLQQVAGDLRPGLRGVALLTAAGVLVEEGKKEEALALYQKVADTGSVPSELRDLATLRSIDLTSAGEITADQQKDVQKALRKIWSNDKSPWRFHARLQAASLQAASGAYGEAAALLEPVIEIKEIPPSLAAKIRALHHVYALQAATQDKKAEEEQKNSQG